MSGRGSCGGGGREVLIYTDGRGQHLGEGGAERGGGGEGWEKEAVIESRQGREMLMERMTRRASGGGSSGLT